MPCPSCSRRPELAIGRRGRVHGRSDHSEWSNRRASACGGSVVAHSEIRRTGQIPLRARICYSRRILQFAKFFNGGIEKIVYEPPVRTRIGMGTSGTVYTSPAWSMNVVYARLKPRGVFSTLLFGSLLGVFRASTWILYKVCSWLRPS